MLVVLLKQHIIKLHNFLKMNFRPAILMACSRLLKLKHVHYMCIFFILFLIFHICGKSQMERTNKSKKSLNHIYSLLLIWLECISLALLGLPCYHYETEVILLNSILSISIQTSIIDICFQSFFVTHYLFFMREFYKGHSQHWQRIMWLFVIIR